MKSAIEKVRYLQGLAEGINLKDKDQEGKILYGLIEAVGDLCEQVEQLTELEAEIEAGNDELIDSLALLEDIFGDLIGTDEDEELYEVLCNNCGRTYLADFDDFDSDDVICPFCGEQYHIDADLLDELRETEEPNELE